MGGPPVLVGGTAMVHPCQTGWSGRKRSEEGGHANCLLPMCPRTPLESFPAATAFYGQEVALPRTRRVIKEYELL
jgi:hypothetical protein